MESTYGNFVTESERILNDDSVMVAKQPELFTDGRPSENVNISLDSCTVNESQYILSPSNRQDKIATCKNISLSSECKQIYKNICDKPKDEFISSLILATKQDKMLLDQMRTELFESAKCESNFPDGVLAKRQKNRRDEKLATDCYVIHMFLNGEQGDDITSVLSGSGRNVPTPMTLSTKTSYDLPPDLVTNVASLNASVSAIEEFTEKTDNRLTEAVQHLVGLIKAKDKWIEQIEEVVNSLNKTVDELNIKVLNQSNIIHVMDKNIADLQNYKKVNESKYEKAMTEVATLTEALRKQRKLFNDFAQEDGCEKSRIRGDIKVMRRTLNSLQDDIQHCTETMNSCTASITYLRKETSEINKVSLKAQDRYADVVGKKITSQRDGCSQTCSVVNFQKNVYPRLAEDSADFNEHESSEEDDDMSVKKTFSQPKVIPTKQAGPAGLYRRVSPSKNIVAIDSQARCQPPQHSRHQAEATGNAIPVIMSRTFYKQSSSKFYVGNIASSIRAHQVRTFMSNKHVKCLDIKMLPSNTDGIIGAQITVQDNDVKRVLSQKFWPDNVYARRWYD